MRKTNIVIHPCMPRAKRHFQRKAKHYDHKPRSPRAPNTGLHKHSLQMATGQFVPVGIYYESSLPKGKPDLKMGEMENPLISGTAFAKRKMQNSTQGKYQCYKPEHLLEWEPVFLLCFFSFPPPLFSFEVSQILSWLATGGQQRQDFSVPVLIHGLIDSHLNRKSTVCSPNSLCQILSDRFRIQQQGMFLVLKGMQSSNWQRSV